MQSNKYENKENILRFFFNFIVPQIILQQKYIPKKYKHNK